jgi:MFS family permease
MFSAFGQLAGNGAFSYYLPAVLETMGITEDVQQANFGLGYSAFQWVFSLGGAALVERVGRRKLMIFSMGGCTYTNMGVLNHETAKWDLLQRRHTLRCD